MSVAVVILALPPSLHSLSPLSPPLPLAGVSAGTGISSYEQQHGAPPSPGFSGNPPAVPAAATGPSPMRTRSGVPLHAGSNVGPLTGRQRTMEHRRRERELADSDDDMDVDDDVVPTALNFDAESEEEDLDLEAQVCCSSPRCSTSPSFAVLTPSFFLSLHPEYSAGPRRPSSGAL